MNSFIIFLNSFKFYQKFLTENKNTVTDENWKL